MVVVRMRRTKMMLGELVRGAAMQSALRRRRTSRDYCKHPRRIQFSKKQR